MDVSKIKYVNGAIANIKDTVARQRIAQIVGTFANKSHSHEYTDIVNAPWTNDDFANVAYELANTSLNVAMTVERDLFIHTLNNTVHMSQADRDALNNCSEKFDEYDTIIQGLADFTTNSINNCMTIVNNVSNKAESALELAEETVNYAQETINKASAAIDGKQDKLTAGAGITIDNNSVITATGAEPEWSAIHNKPTSFTPSYHIHAISGVTNLQSTLDGKQAVINSSNKLDYAYLKNVPATGVSDVKVNGTSVVNNGVAEIPISTNVQWNQIINTGAKIAEVTIDGNTTNVFAPISDDPPVTDVQINGASVINNGIANIPIATSSSVGVSKIAGGDFGVNILSNGGLYVSKANETDINSRTNGYKPIVPNTLDYAVKRAMCDGNGATWTNEEQRFARKRMGFPSYHYNQELAVGTSGKVCLVKVMPHVTNITIRVTETTNTTYEGTLVIATQNFGTSAGYRPLSADYYGFSGELYNKLVIVSNSSGLAVYIDADAWSKNHVDMTIVAPGAAPTMVMQAVDSIPTEDRYPITWKKLPWTQIDNKPSFKTVATSGNYNDLTNKPTIPTIPSTWEWTAVANKPSTFTPSAHSHPISDVTNLQSTLNGKQNVINASNKLDYSLLSNAPNVEKFKVITRENSTYNSIKSDLAGGYRLFLNMGGKMMTFAGETPNTADNYYFASIDTALTSPDIYVISIKCNKTAGWDTNLTYQELQRIVNSSNKIDYSFLTNVPTSFPPSSHNHDDRYFTETEVTSKLGNKQNVINSSNKLDYAFLSNVPSTFTPSAHGHPISDVVNLQSSLNNKQNLINASNKIDYSFISNAPNVEDIKVITRDDSTYASIQSDLRSGKRLFLNMSGKMMAFAGEAPNTGDVYYFASLDTALTNPDVYCISIKCSQANGWDTNLTYTELAKIGDLPKVFVATYGTTTPAILDWYIERNYFILLYRSGQVYYFNYKNTTPWYVFSAPPDTGAKVLHVLCDKDGNWSTRTLLLQKEINASNKLDYAFLSNVPEIPSGSVEWVNINNKPTFATVATNGSYNDLKNKPTIPTIPSTWEWNNIANKPSSFTPSSHTHDDRYYTESEVDTKLGGKQNTINSSNKLAASNVSGLATVATNGSYNDLKNKPTIPTIPSTWEWSAIANKPSTFAPSTHSHNISDITNLQTTLNSKINASGGTFTGTVSLASTNMALSRNNNTVTIYHDGNKVLNFVNATAIQMNGVTLPDAGMISRLYYTSHTSTSLSLACKTSYSSPSVLHFKPSQNLVFTSLKTIAIGGSVINANIDNVDVSSAGGSFTFSAGVDYYLVKDSTSVIYLSSYDYFNPNGKLITSTNVNKIPYRAIQAMKMAGFEPNPISKAIVGTGNYAYHYDGTDGETTYKWATSMDINTAKRQYYKCYSNNTWQSGEEYGIPMYSGGVV